MPYEYWAILCVVRVSKLGRKSSNLGMRAPRTIQIAQYPQKISCSAHESGGTINSAPIAARVHGQSHAGSVGLVRRISVYASTPLMKQGAKFKTRTPRIPKAIPQVLAAIAAAATAASDVICPLFASRNRSGSVMYI